MPCLSYAGYPNNLGEAYSALVTAFDGKPCLEQEQTIQPQFFKLELDNEKWLA